MSFSREEIIDSKLFLVLWDSAANLNFYSLNNHPLTTEKVVLSAEKDKTLLELKH